MNELADIVDVVLSEEMLTLGAAVVTGGLSVPVAIGGLAVAGLAAALLPKTQATKVMGVVRKVVSFKRK